jgi:predicted TPR repeat methyltransferase
MLEESIEKNCYNFLICGDVVSVLNELKVAADRAQGVQQSRSMLPSAQAVQGHECILNTRIQEVLSIYSRGKVSAVVAADVFGEFSDHNYNLFN